MNVSELFIRRPVMTTLVWLSVLVFGGMAYLRLPVSDLPNVDFPTISVSASLPGASPETMAAAVATPLEREFSTIQGIDSMSSTSALGSTSITIQFSLDRSIDDAALDVQSAIAATARRLPPEMPSPPSFRKVNPADSPILFLALGSDTLPLSTVNEFAETVMAQRISTVSGVAQVQVQGQQKYAVRVQTDPRTLAARGIAMDDVQRAIQGANSNLPTGALRGRAQSFTIETNGQLSDAAGFREVVVAYRDGAPVRLREVALVSDSVENDQSASWINDKRSVTLTIQKQPGTNTVAVVDAIRALLPTLRAQIPAAVDVRIVFDRTVTIRESVHDVQLTLAGTIALVVLVIFLFLRNLPATIIPSVAIPMSIIGTFGAMYLLGFSVNNLSLMALTLSVGFVVDDAIVVLENIVRRMEHGEAVWEASLHGAREIGFTIVSMTISLAAVFLPVLFMGGILGRLLNEFAVTISIAILISGIVSLTLTPMLCSRFLRPHGEKKHGAWYRASERVFDAMQSAYRWTLEHSIRHRVLLMLLTAITLAGTAWLFLHLPKGFIPTEDTGQILITTEGAQDISYDEMVAHQQALAAIVLKNPYLDNFTSSVGASGGNATLNTGRLFLRFKPRAQRPHVEKILADLRPQLAQVPGIRAFAQIPPSIRVGGRSSRSPYQFTLFGPDLAELYRLGPEFEKKVRENVRGVLDVTSDLQLSSPQVYVQVNRDKAATLGISATQIEQTLYNAYGSRQVSSIYTPTNLFYVILEVDPKFQLEPASLELLYVRASNGELVPITTVTDISRRIGPLTVAHSGQLPAVTISFGLQPGVSLGDAVRQIGDLAERELPPTISTSFQGEAQAFQSSLQGLGVLLVMAILVIYIVLGILYESFIHPLTILSGLPAAGVGALLTLLLFGYELNLYGFVGILMLIGIVKKNAIMMIDFALETQRNDHLEPERAIFEAALVRFRPIMMTTFAALMGALPIALGFGAGADARRPLGLAVVGGLLVSQLLTLYITPVVYIYLERVQQFLRRKQKPKAQPPATRELELAGV